MLDKGSEEKLLTDYEPKRCRKMPRERKSTQASCQESRRRGSLFRVDLAKVIAKKEHFVFSGFLDKFIT
ncbi:ECU10_0635 [Encephalitozoon cuniculi GB-M1]|uniref:ECU10_0635 protein n=1 Tax=Encephalitozoon cuniculi (strain GB-M1) TaxID=284813 RepID=A0A1T5PD78_ENCCU|nr:uncharacterized protein ECU10_0635 [Encephalitozoon cuniculi GB-M1]SKD10707.1 ECU10_0635 [Encephalitozoon cuniculi GB-M1]